MKVWYPVTSTNPARWIRFQRNMYAEAMFLHHMDMDLYFHHASFRSLAARWNATWGKAMEGCMGNDGYVDPTGQPMENAWLTCKV